MTVFMSSVCLTIVVFVLHHASSFSYRSPSLQRPLMTSYLCNSKSTPELECTKGGVLSSSTIVIALTREEGKNEKLRDALMANDLFEEFCQSSELSFRIEEIPCIEHADGSDTDKIVPTLSSSQFDYVVVTSPEAAKVLASAWDEAGRPALGKVAAVGKATEQALKKFGIDTSFVPSKATAATLVVELPPSDDAVDENRPTTVLYPASMKAQETLQDGLNERGFEVLRLNTYDTVPASWGTDQLSLAKSAGIACFGSPSAVKAWLRNVSPSVDGHDCDGKPEVLAACIGETSAKACRSNNWDESDIFYPEKPGVDGWAQVVVDALKFLSAKK